MTMTVTLLIAIAVLILIIFVIGHICKGLQEENTKLKDENTQQKATIVEMYHHAEELAQIQQDKSDVNKKINEAKTDEEITGIINSIVHTNNDKLRNKAKE